MQPGQKLKQWLTNMLPDYISEYHQPCDCNIHETCNVCKPKTPTPTANDVPRPSEKPYKEWTDKQRLNYRIAVLEKQLERQCPSSNPARTSDLFTLYEVLKAAKNTCKVERERDEARKRASEWQRQNSKNCLDYENLKKERDQLLTERDAFTKYEFKKIW